MIKFKNFKNLSLSESSNIESNQHTKATDIYEVIHDLMSTGDYGTFTQEKIVGSNWQDLTPELLSLYDTFFTIEYLLNYKSVKYVSVRFLVQKETDDSDNGRFTITLFVRTRFSIGSGKKGLVIIKKDKNLTNSIESLMKELLTTLSELEEKTMFLIQAFINLLNNIPNKNDLSLVINNLKSIYDGFVDSNKISKVLDQFFIDSSAPSSVVKEISKKGSAEEIFDALRIAVNRFKS